MSSVSKPKEEAKQVTAPTPASKDPFSSLQNLPQPTTTQVSNPTISANPKTPSQTPASEAPCETCPLCAKGFSDVDLLVSHA